MDRTGLGHWTSLAVYSCMAITAVAMARGCSPIALERDVGRFRMALSVEHDDTQWSALYPHAFTLYADTRTRVRS